MSFPPYTSTVILIWISTLDNRDNKAICFITVPAQRTAVIDIISVYRWTVENFAKKFTLFFMETYRVQDFLRKNFILCWKITILQGVYLNSIRDWDYSDDIRKFTYRGSLIFMIIINLKKFLKSHIFYLCIIWTVIFLQTTCLIFLTDFTAVTKQEIPRKVTVLDFQLSSG